MLQSTLPSLSPRLLRSILAVSLISTVLLIATSSGFAQAGVVAHWSADGNVDDTVGGNNGAFQISTAYAPGYTGQAFSFDGTNYIVVPDSPSVSPTGPFTVEAWIKPNFNNFQQGIVEKYVTPGTNGFFLRIDSTRLQFGVCGAVLPCALASGFTPVSPGIWHHVVAISDGTNVRVYLDGVMDAYSANGGVTPTDGPTTLKIGARGDDVATRFNGSIDDIKIYNYALPFPIPSNQHSVANGDVNGLIAAINLSNATPGPDTITLANDGSYVLTHVAGPDSWHGPSGLPIIQGSNTNSRASLTINGNGSTIQRSDAPATPEFRIFHALYANVILDSVIIKNGRVHGPNRCGGGGLYLNVSDTVIRNSTITENWADEGGGICNNNTSTLTIENSTISHNTAYGGRTGGGLLNFSGGQVSVSNSTFYENQADGSPGFEGRGDAFADAFSSPGWLKIKNSIVASPTRGRGNDCMWFTPVSLGHNIFSDSSCGLNFGGGDTIIPNLVLRPLANYGGPTPTHALPAGSQATDAIPLADCTDIEGNPVLLDQRGTARPIGAGCDIGAVEQEPYDTTPPSIAPAITGTLGNNGWYVSDVSVSWSVTDAESGITSSSGCDASGVTNDTAGVVFTCTATSSGGTSTQSVTIKRDATAPDVNISSPTAGIYLLNQPVSASFACSDIMSGIAGCSGTTVDGGALDTTAAGGKTFSVTATDNAGNSTSATVNYSVGYGVVALFDQTKAHKSGSAVPIKIRLVDANGVNVSSAATVVHAVSVVQVSSQASTNVEDAGNANPDLDFRYDADLAGYVFNLKTTGFGTGSYVLKFVVGSDTAQYSVGFQVRQ